MALAEGEPKLEALQQLQDDTAEAQRGTEAKLADWQQRWDSHTRNAGESNRAAEVERTKLNYLDRQAIDLSRRREALEAEQKATDVAALDAAGQQLHRRPRDPARARRNPRQPARPAQVQPRKSAGGRTPGAVGAERGAPAVADGARPAGLAGSVAARRTGPGRKRRQRLAGAARARPARAASANRCRSKPVGKPRWKPC